MPIFPLRVMCPYHCSWDVRWEHNGEWGLTGLIKEERKEESINEKPFEWFGKQAAKCI